MQCMKLLTLETLAVFPEIQFSVVKRYDRFGVLLLQQTFPVCT